jgi:hypothetical protein
LTLKVLDLTYTSASLLHVQEISRILSGSKKKRIGYHKKQKAARSPILIQKKNMHVKFPDSIEESPLHSPKVKGEAELNTYTIEAMGEEAIEDEPYQEHTF